MISSGDIQHDMLLLALNDELYTSCTLSETATILDVGTGTGTWACQIARRNPRSRVYGIDLHQVAPDETPQNVVFETVNVMTGFPFNTGTFDFVHSRLLVGGITDWDTYLANLHRITKRGGHVECVEVELQPRYRGQSPHEQLDKLSLHMMEILRKTDLNATIAEQLKQKMEHSGFTEVNETVIETPIGLWPDDDHKKKIGQLALEFSKVHLVQWVSASMIEQGADRTEIEQSAASVVKELASDNLQAYFRWRFVNGRKSA